MGTTSESVFHLSTGRNDYDYIASALRIELRTEDFRRFGINGREALSVLQVEPALRSDLVKQISDLLKERRLIGNGYNSRSHGSLFIDADSIGFEPRLRFGGDQIRQYTDRTLLNSLRDCGLYKRAERFQNHTPIDIGIINALGGTSLDTFWSTMEQELELLDFPMRLVGEEQVRSASRADLEKSVETLRKGNPDIMLAFFPDASDEDEDDWGAYHHLKS